MAADADFWGEIPSAGVRTPAAILKEQATLLGQKTRHLLKAKVETSVVRDRLTHRLMIETPTLEDYAYELLRVSSDPVNIYPVKTHDWEERELHTEEQFIQWLRETLSSPETKRVISSLLAQAAA